MDWIEDTAIYAPIEALFTAPVYKQTLQICWEKKYYLSQRKMLVHMLRLQQQDQVLSALTAEDMMDWLVDQSRKTLRERLWKFSLEDHDKTVVQPLLMLTWQVNVSMKMRDIEFEARMVLNSPEAESPCFREPRILHLAEEAIRSLLKKQQQDPGSSLLTPQEVAMQVVPRVLQGFWVHPASLSCVMPSLQLSTLTVGVTKAVLDQLSSSLTSMENQVTFSRSIRDEKTLSIQEKVRQKYVLDVLVEKLNCFEPELLTNIVGVTVGEITAMFEPQKLSEVLNTQQVKLDDSFHPAAVQEGVSSTTLDGGSNEEPSLKEDTTASQKIDSSLETAPLEPLAAPDEAPAAEAPSEGPLMPLVTVLLTPLFLMLLLPKTAAEAPVDAPAADTPVEVSAAVAPVDASAADTPVEVSAAEAPVDTPATEASASADTRDEAPAAVTPADTTAEAPAEAPADAPTEAPATEASADTCDEATAADAPAETPAAEAPAAEALGDAPTEAPATEASADTTAEAPAYAPVAETLAEASTITTVQEGLTTSLADAKEKLEQPSGTTAELRKTKKKRIRRFFRRLFRTVFCCCVPKDADKE